LHVFENLISFLYSVPQVFPIPHSQRYIKYWLGATGRERESSASCLFLSISHTRFTLSLNHTIYAPCTQANAHPCSLFTCNHTMYVPPANNPMLILGFHQFLCVNFIKCI
jgi:hypothetical protein